MEKRKKPKFYRQDISKAIRVQRSSWRRPKGLQSKMRHGFRGRANMPSTGYGAPLEFKKEKIGRAHV